jgi:hypothetical protein
MPAPERKPEPLETADVLVIVGGVLFAVGLGLAWFPLGVMAAGAELVVYGLWDGGR